MWELKHVGIRACLDLGAYDATSTRTETRLSHFYCLTTNATYEICNTNQLYKLVMKSGHTNVSKGPHRPIHNYTMEPTKERASGPAPLLEKVWPAHKSYKGKCGRTHNYTKVSANVKLYTGKSGTRSKGPPPAASTPPRT